MNKPHHRGRLRTALALSSLLLALSACGGGGSDGSSKAPAANTAQAGQAFSYSVSDSTSPIAGTTVSLADDAIGAGSVEVNLRYEEALPGALPQVATDAGALVLSKTLVIDKSRPGSFDRAATVTTPYNAKAMGSTDAPSVLHWNESAGDYEAMAVTAFDPAKGTVTFQTAHFSKFVVVGIPGLGDQVKGLVPETNAMSVDTGFRPSADSFFRANISSYSSPGGNCLGMSSYADWFFERAKTALNGGTGLFASYLEGDQAAPADDITAEELIVRAHAAASQQWQARQDSRFSSLSHEDTALLMIQAMKLTGKPQLLAMWGNPSWWERYVLGRSSWAHALVVYRYDPSTQVFALYDPNLRGDDSAGVYYVPGSGFTGLTKTGLYPTEPDVFAFDAVGTYYAPEDMRALFDGAAAGWSEGQYGKFSLNSVTVDPSTRTAHVADGSAVRLSGTITPQGGESGNEPNTVDLFVAGKLIGSYAATGLAFDITLPPLQEGPSTEIMLVARCSNCDRVINGRVGTRAASLYGTFTRFKIKAGTVMDNWGFELGDLSFWDSLRYLWDGTGQVTPSDKSAVVSTGNDPIATTIPMVLHGSHAVRINNRDNDYHISRLSRDLVVPANVSSYALSFNWAAVLEDPDHEPAKQPYVHVSVTVVGTGESIYERRYYANDPTFPGWKSFQGGDWKAIDWQSVNLSGLERLQGQTLRLVVEAADCGLGGHGGYAYLDAEE